MTRPREFHLTIRSDRRDATDGESIRRLRWVLKTLLRSHGFTVTKVQQATEGQANAKGN